MIMGNINATYLAIINMALVDLGENPKSTWAIGSGSDTIETLIDNSLENTAKWVLRRHPWNSASTWKTFDSDDQATLPDQSVYTTAYTQPTDYLRLNGKPFNSAGVELNSRERPPEWQVSGNLILTKTTGLMIKYVYYTEIDASPDTASNWHGDLQRYMALELAKTLVTAVSSDRQLKESLRQDAKDLFVDATMSDNHDAQGQSAYPGTIVHAPFYPRVYDG